MLTSSKRQHRKQNDFMSISHLKRFDIDSKTFKSTFSCAVLSFQIWLQYIFKLSFHSIIRNPYVSFKKKLSPLQNQLFPWMETNSFSSFQFFPFRFPLSVRGHSAISKNLKCDNKVFSNFHKPVLSSIQTKH